MADVPMPDAPASDPKPRRRFAPQLVEETVKSSKANKEQEESRATEDVAPATSEPEKPRRRFAPQLVEETTKSSKPKNAQADQDSQEPAPSEKPRRRFAPQLVEETVKSSNKSDSTSTVAEAPKPRTTRDASVQVDVDMKDAPATRRRFAPVPIETTFDSYRVGKNPHGPTAELTPDPSPTDALPPIPALPSAPVIETKKTSDQKPKRRFAPQLIETSRRAKRAGQDGPATKPTDKTDITPGTNHIYVQKPKRKQQPASSLRTSITASGAESGDQSPRFLPRRQQSLKQHCNTRRATRANSYLPELEVIPSSESDKSDDEDGAPKGAPFSIGAPARAPSDGETWATRNPDAKDRRESCDERSNHYLLAVAAREAFRQRELETAMSAYPNGLQPAGVEHFFVRDNSEDDVSYEEPLRHGKSNLMVRRKSTDPTWAVSEMRQHAEKLAGKTKQTREPTFDDDSLDGMDIEPPPEDPLWTTGPRPPSRTALQKVESQSPWQSPYLIAQSPRIGAHTGAADRGFAPSPRVQPEATGMKAGPFSMPFANFNAGKEDRDLLNQRKRQSPPMAGEDLKFRTCPSPKATRMEPDHPWPTHGDGSRPEERQRDLSGETGLWRGYCVGQAPEDMVQSAGFNPPALLATPGEPASPADPFAMAFSASMGSTPTSPSRRDPPKGLHMLHGLDDRLKMEKARKEYKEKLLAEFDDAFITQVYNYISLGYPATARAFDDELSKISGIAIDELRQDDNKKIEKGFMLEMELRVGSDSSSDEEMRTPEEDEKRTQKPPRWRALRLYILEWARQHPDLGGSGNTSGWGVRARRGSWAI
ncbi:hypothetical protein G7054_g12219 [Neopestalotiopsis clavispora]|nr:hypothetical protein G7054_g12219 [Neopestalotiopsis clavispora]